jgi:hypothetical protein
MATINNLTVNVQVNSYQKYTEEVRRWNEVMLNSPGATDQETIKRIGRQSNFLIEEANEVRDGFDIGSVQEMLDGHLDTRFVNDQIGVYLEALGIDLEAAWNEVCTSNNSKFSTDLDMMLASAKRHTEALGDEVVVQIAPSAEGQPTTYILKRLSNGKIMKPDCFREPNLRQFVPKHLRGAK